MAWFIGLSYSGEWCFSSIRFSIRKYMHYRHPLPSSCPFFFVFFPIIIVVVEVAVINFLICRLVLLVRSLAILPLLFESDSCFLEYESYILKYEPQMVVCSLLRPKLSRATSCITITMGRTWTQQYQKVQWLQGTTDISALIA